MWILWKLRFQNCEFCEKWDFRYVNFVKNEISEMWILEKFGFSMCEFLDKMWIFAPVWNDRCVFLRQIIAMRIPDPVGTDEIHRYWKLIFFKYFQTSVLFVWPCLGPSQGSPSPASGYRRSRRSPTFPHHQRPKQILQNRGKHRLTFPTLLHSIHSLATISSPVRFPNFEKQDWKGFWSKTARDLYSMNSFSRLFINHIYFVHKSVINLPFQDWNHDADNYTFCQINAHWDKNQLFIQK